MSTLMELAAMWLAAKDTRNLDRRAELPCWPHPRYPPTPDNNPTRHRLEGSRSCGRALSARYILANRANTSKAGIGFSRDVSRQKSKRPREQRGLR